MRTFGRTACAVAIVAFLATIECRAESPHYVFVLPDGYVGWIQVIFSSPGTLRWCMSMNALSLGLINPGYLKPVHWGTYLLARMMSSFTAVSMPTTKRSCPQC